MVPAAKTANTAATAGLEAFGYFISARDALRKCISFFISKVGCRDDDNNGRSRRANSMNENLFFYRLYGAILFFPWQHGNGYKSVPLKSQTLYWDSGTRLSCRSAWFSFTPLF